MSLLHSGPGHVEGRVLEPDGLGFGQLAHPVVDPVEEFLIAR